MSSNSLADGIAQQLKCSICLEEFKQPKLLRCYHSFCEECIQGLLEKAEENVVKCPQCRTEMKISNGNTRSLKSNFFINNILELMEKNRRRGLERVQSEGALAFPPCTCDKKTIAKCQNCNTDMCDACIDTHLQNPRTRNHEIVRQGVALCPDHMFEEKRFFCEECEELCCEKCVGLYHTKHKNILVNSVLNTEKKAIDWLLVRCKAKIPKLNWETARLKVMAEMTEKNAQETTAEIENHFEALITALEEKRRALKAEVEAVKNEKLTIISCAQENVTLEIESLQSGIEFTEQATKEGNEKEFLSMRKQILARLEELSSTDTPKRLVNGRWEVYLHSPYKINHNKTRPSLLTNCIRLQSDTVTSSLKMLGGEDGVMYTSFMNQLRKFVITLKDENGARMAIGGQDVRVAIRVPSEPNSEKPLSYDDISIHDNNNGTHIFDYEPRAQGVYFLRITINGRSMSDDFEWIVEAALGFGDRANKGGAIQLYPPVGKATAWNRFIGGKYSWKVKRVRYDEHTEVRAGVMMDATNKKWSWSNGKREEPQDVSLTTIMSAIPSWLEQEELTFFNNEETGCFIIYHEARGECDVFKRCPGTAARPFIYPPSHDVFSMTRSHLERRHVKQNSSLD